MSNLDLREKIKLVGKVLKAIHRGEDIEMLKKRFRDVLSMVSPFEIPLIEQMLVREGVDIDEILKLCDLHVALFREFLKSRVLKGIPRGHPVDLFMRENEFILKWAEALGLYSKMLQEKVEDVKEVLELIKEVLGEVKRIKLHYRKIQMLLFPYFERRGIIAVPRVLWGREDQIIVKLRKLSKILVEALSDPVKYVDDVSRLALELAGEIGELVFRENQIMLPAAWTLLSEGEWAAIHEIAEDIGWIVEVRKKWIPKAKPVMPYEIKGRISREQIERLPRELRAAALFNIEPDNYKIQKEDDLDLDTGFLSIGEVKAIFNSLPIEITYANRDDRVKFYSESRFKEKFIRTKTIIGRRLEFCHSPRLENLVRRVVNEVKDNPQQYREFWTKKDNKIIRVLIVPVISGDGGLLGIMEIVEDLTLVVNNAEKVKMQIMVL